MAPSPILALRICNCVNITDTSDNVLYQAEIAPENEIPQVTIYWDIWEVTF